MVRQLLLALGVAWGIGAGALFADDLAAELRALDALRNGKETPLDEVERLGKELLARYDQPAQQAQIRFQLAHVHAQSGLVHPEKIIAHAQAALDSKLLTPEQRGLLYSYQSSAHEVDTSIKDFSKRRRKAVEPLLLGAKELLAFDLPAVAPELPAIARLRDGFEDPAERERLRREHEAQVRAREEVQRVRTLMQYRDALHNQIRWLYARDPKADEELATLAKDALGADLAKKLLADVASERERRSIKKDKK